MTTRIGIAGISGRMGRLLAAEAATQAILAGGTSRGGDGPPECVIFPDIHALAENCDIVIDFTHASTVTAHAEALAAANTPWVLGTTGFGAAESDAVSAAATVIPVLASPNFCTGVNILLLLAERLGAALSAAEFDAEIVEMHHRQKVDAPSGTALGIGRAVAAGRGVALEDVIVSGRDGHTGPRADGQIGFATLRGGQIVGSHTLSFTSGFEQIALTHHALDRRVFASGAVRAASWLAGQGAGLYSMKDVLGF
jgi:4-hydroxy-tetrahydrodipicolinate reductase